MSRIFILGLSSFNTWIEESVNVNNVLKETPLGLGSRLSVKVVLHLLVHLSSLFGFDLDGNSGLSWENSDDSSNSKIFKHFLFIKLIIYKINELHK